MWKPRGLLLRKIGAGRLVHVRSRFSPSKKGRILWKPSNSCDVCYGITYRLRPTQKQSNIILHVNGNIGVIFLSGALQCLNCIR